MQLQSTISLCKLLSESKRKRFKCLDQSLKAIQGFSSKDSNTTLGSLIFAAIDRIRELLRFNEQLADNSENPELKSELLIKIANSYKNSIDLRITWLEALANHHDAVSIELDYLYLNDLICILFLV